MSDRAVTAPPSVRTYLWVHALAVAAACLLGLVFLWLGRSVHKDDPGNPDHVIHSWAVRHRAHWPFVTVVFRVATRFGNPDVATAATGIIGIVLYILQRRGLARVRPAEPLVWLAAIIGSRFLGVFLKHAYHRPRPPLVDRLVTETTYSFPSSHSVFAAVYFSMLAYILVRMIPPKRIALRMVAVILCVFGTLVVAASRIWLGVHYPSDVLGGLLVGVAWVLIVWLAWGAWDSWRRGHRTFGGA